MPKRYLAAVLLAAIAVASRRAECDPVVDPHLARAKVDLEAHLYSEAISELLAIDASARPDELWFDLGEAYRLSYKVEPALDAYHKYLALTPAGAFADQARVHVAELAKAVADSALEVAAARATWQAQRDTAHRERIAGVIVGGISLPVAAISIIALATGHRSGQVTGPEAIGIGGATVGIIGLSIGMPTCFVIAGRTDPGEFQPPPLLLHPGGDDKSVWLFSGQF